MFGHVIKYVWGSQAECPKFHESLGEMFPARSWEPHWDQELCVHGGHLCPAAVVSSGSPEEGI